MNQLVSTLRAAASKPEVLQRLGAAAAVQLRGYASQNPVLANVPDKASLRGGIGCQSALAGSTKQRG